MYQHVDSVLPWRKYLSTLPLHGQASASQPVVAAATNGTKSNHWDNIVQAFKKRIDEAAAYRSKGQRDAITAWLQHNGSIELTTLWTASGVRNQHDYGGIGSSFTRNMKRAGGPKEWYTCERHPKKVGEWVYNIIPELVDPLKRAFGI